MVSYNFTSNYISLCNINNLERKKFTNWNLKKFIQKTRFPLKGYDIFLKCICSPVQNSVLTLSWSIFCKILSDYSK